MRVSLLLRDKTQRSFDRVNSGSVLCVRRSLKLKDCHKLMDPAKTNVKQQLSEFENCHSVNSFLVQKYI